jgi:hypothetical protein
VWIRKVYRDGVNAKITLPRDVMRQWDQLHIRHVEIRFLGDRMEVWPLTIDQLQHHPRQEEEDLPAHADRHAKP